MSWLRPTITVAVAGHRDLLDEDRPRLEAEVLGALREIRTRFPRTRYHVRLLSALARGADRLVAELVASERVEAELGIELVPTLPHPPDRLQELEGPTALLEGRVVRTLEGSFPNADARYTANARRLIRESEILLALWDGIDNGKRGGTSDVVRQARETPLSLRQRARARRALDRREIWRISTRRDSNRFPATRPFSLRIERGDRLNPSPASVLMGLARAGSELLSLLVRPYVIFALLLLSTLGLGWVGLSEYCGSAASPCQGVNARDPTMDLLWLTVGLPLLQTQGEIVHGTGVPATLLAAEFLGALTAGYTLIGAFFALLARPLWERIRVIVRSASGSLPMRLLRRTPLHRLLPRGEYAVVVGLGWSGREIIEDLVRRGNRVVGIDIDPDPKKVEAAKALGALVLTGDATRQDVLRQARVHRAARVFVTAGAAPEAQRDDSIAAADEANTRILLQLAVYAERSERRTTMRLARAVGWNRVKGAEWHVGISELRAQDLAHRSVELPAHIQLRTFGLYQGCAQKLLAEHPIDRFWPDSEADLAHVIVVGYTPLARAIIHEAMQVGHFPQRGPDAPQLRCTVIAPDARSCERDFLRRYPVCAAGPAFTRDGHAPEPGSLADLGERLRRSALPAAGATLHFSELPLSDLDALGPEGDTMWRASPAETANVYVCLDEGAESARFAATVLPRLEWLKREKHWDVQLFYYYDYPEREPSKQLQQGMNPLGERLYVSAFDTSGSTRTGADRQIVETIHDRQLESLARHVNAAYHLLFHFDPGQQDPEHVDHVISRHLQIDALPAWSERLIRDRRTLESDREDAEPGAGTARAATAEERLVDTVSELWSRGSAIDFVARLLWARQNEYNRASSRRAAQHALLKLRWLGIDQPHQLARLAGPGPDELDALARAEHRRWGAEKMLLGFSPLPQELPGAEGAAQARARWFSDGRFRQAWKDQKSHADLVPGDHLRRVEQLKDRSQVLLLPHMMAVALLGDTALSERLRQLRDPAGTAGPAG